VPAVAVTDLHKSYGTLEVLEGVSFEIEAGFIDDVGQQRGQLAACGGTRHRRPPR